MRRGTWNVERLDGGADERSDVVGDEAADTGDEEVLQAGDDRVRPGDHGLDDANREQPDGSIAYLTLSVLPLDEELPERGLLLLVEDITEVGRLEQRLVQATNELTLIQARLNKGE